jgi:hypothetical protein
MLYNQSAKKNKYTRPAEALNYVNLGNVLTSETATNKETMVKVPAIVKLRPLHNFNHYAEATSEGIAESSRIVCSGSLVYVMAGIDGTSVAGVGILKNDTKPGDVAAAYTEGRAWVPGMTISDTLQDLDAVAKALAGKTAYWDVTNGNLDSSAATGHIAIGTFTGQLKLGSGDAQIAWAEVDLRIVEEETAVALPSDAAFTAFTNAISFTIELSAFEGLEQRVKVRAACNNPSAEIKPSGVYIKYGGGDPIYAESGFEIPFTAAAGEDETFDITVTAELPDGTTVTRTVSYEADFSATVAPANLAEA